MKRIAFVAAAIVLAACSSSEKPAAADSSASAAAPAPEMAAPAMTDSTVKPDSGAMAAPAADTTKH